MCGFFVGCLFENEQSAGGLLAERIRPLKHCAESRYHSHMHHKQQYTVAAVCFKEKKYIPDFRKEEKRKKNALLLFPYIEMKQNYARSSMPVLCTL